MVIDVLSAPEGLLALPIGEQARCAVLVLSGSSGRIEIDRTRLLARHGAAALSLRWFGGPGQPPGICEVPLETFAPALDRLASLSDHLCVIGTSKGAEAALLLASRDQRVRAVAGLSPSAVGWANVGPGRKETPAHGRSSWSADGQPLPFVPYDWFAQQIKDRRSAHQLATEVITAADAGHRVPLPGEPINPPGGMEMARGGTPAADAALGQRVWPALRQLLRLTSSC
jgi:uncharacterized protein